jgi:hypothetical protein
MWRENPRRLQMLLITGFILPMFGMIAGVLGFAFIVFKFYSEKDPRKLRIWAHILVVSLIAFVVFIIFLLCHMAKKTQDKHAPKAKTAQSANVKGETIASKPVEKKPTIRSSTLVSSLHLHRIDCERVSRKNGTWTQNRILREACRKSGGDRDALLTLLTENPNLDPTLVSPPNHDGTRDHGLGQFNSYWHKDFIASRAFKYWDKQLDRFVTIFKQRPTAFCAYKVRFKGLRLLVIRDDA